jgi:hypothetical protein
MSSYSSSSTDLIPDLCLGNASEYVNTLGISFKVCMCGRNFKSRESKCFGCRGINFERDVIPVATSSVIQYVTGQFVLVKKDSIRGIDDSTFDLSDLVTAKVKLANYVCHKCKSLAVNLFRGLLGKAYSSICYECSLLCDVIECWNAPLDRLCSTIGCGRMANRKCRDHVLFGSNAFDDTIRDINTYGCRTTGHEPMYDGYDTYLARDFLKSQRSLYQPHLYVESLKCRQCLLLLKLFCHVPGCDTLAMITVDKPGDVESPFSTCQVCNLDIHTCKKHYGCDVAVTNIITTPIPDAPAGSLEYRLVLQPNHYVCRRILESCSWCGVDLASQLSIKPTNSCHHTACRVFSKFSTPTVKPSRYCSGCADYCVFQVKKSRHDCIECIIYSGNLPQIKMVNHYWIASLKRIFATLKIDIIDGCIQIIIEYLLSITWSDTEHCFPLVLA